MQTRQLATAVSSALITATLGLAATANTASAASLTLFHNNDGESKLLGSGDFGGFDYFLGELNAARTAATGAGRDVLTISSGDNFLAGLAWNASVDRRNAAGGLGSTFDFGGTNQSNYYDALALTAVGYDAITFGNHDFDFGPSVLGDFIDGYESAGGSATFLSANLDVSGEPALAPFDTSGRIASSTIVTRGAEQYGIIGATTENLANISSPGTNITINEVAAAVNAEVAALTGAGVNKIILSSHLQGIDAPNGDEALIPLISGVDVIIAGGGDELLRNGPDANTEARFGPDIDGPYPLISTATDGDGNNIALVTTQGEYRYIGELEV